MNKGSFEFPSNVKQIGSIDDNMKVYIEDYAYKYICQYARAETHSEKIGVLIGEYIEVDKQNIVLISGFIQGKYSDNINGVLTFTDKTWEYIKTRQDRYYRNFEIVGWLHTQPGNGVSISEDDKRFHEENFIEQYQVLFLVDSIEKIDCFFVWDNEKLRQLNGYFIYYDKNDCMREYMIDNKLVKSKSYDYKEDNPPEKEDVAVSYKRLDRNRREEMHQKKVLNLLVGTSGIVVVLCFLMGLLLVQNSQRMNKLETELTSVYKHLNNKAKSSEDTAQVFAYQEESTTNLVQQQSTEITQPVTTATQEETESSKVEETTIKETEKVTEATTQPITQEQEETTQPQTQPQTQAQPTTQPSTNQNTIPATHLVREGDSLSWISKHYYGTNKMINKIMEYNNIKDPNKVYIGMEIKLPNSDTN